MQRNSLTNAKRLCGGLFLFGSLVLLPGVLRADVADAVVAAEQSRVDVLKRIVPSVVCVFSRAGDNGGSGVLISSDGEALTNFHVVAGLGPFVKCGLADGAINWAVVVGVDPTGDLALIRLLGKNGEFRTDFQPAVLGDSDALAPGDRAIVIGNPFLLATNLQPTVTYGIVSGVGRYQYPAGTFLEYTECIQTDASINPGNSGGPMFNAAGELIGINGRASFEKRGRVFTGAGYAISINQAKLFIDHLRSGRIVDHATLGATVQTNRGDGKVYVQEVDPDSDAARIGLKSPDELIRFGGRAITSANDFKNRLGVYPSGWIVPLTYRRDDEIKRAEVRLLPLHSRAELIDQFKTQPFTPPRPEGEETPKAATTASDQVPESYLELYEAEPGFVNLAANKRLLSKVRSSLEKFGVSGATSELRLSGLTSDGKQVDVVVSPKGTAVRVTGGISALAKAGDDPADLPPGSGGLLTSLEHLRHFVTEPEAFFTDHVYIGSEPSSAGGPLVDVVLTTRGETVDRWFFGRPDGQLVGVETQIRPDLGPCKIQFGPVSTYGEIAFPESIEVSHLGVSVLNVKWSDVTIKLAE